LAAAFKSVIICLARGFPQIEQIPQKCRVVDIDNRRGADSPITIQIAFYLRNHKNLRQSAVQKG
jgi:hypothetical protein